MKRFFNFSGMRFIVAGGVNTAFTYFIYYGLVRVFEYRVAYTISFIVGLLFGYFMNVLWVFKEKPGVKSAMTYPLAVALQYFLGIGLLSVLVELGGVGEKVAPIFVAALMFPIMYLIMRLIFYRSAAKNG
ncbi:GtrA family protein [Paraburkholderia sp. USG1]|uniref:GtrA family protein n=1 Tax=Paraburkholderia sp. USG1 TaxID=2952268 RepID=UPI002862788F|nr:GtrA family protein [Paraburkholderia sp. USG1]MDR8401558.1 GtrA family protein [Paraburkholderia sp. USG1]